MAELDQARLRASLNRYLLARGEQRRTGTAAAEVRAARRDLVALMQDAGWEPPPAVLDLLADEDGRSHRRSA